MKNNKRAVSILLIAAVILAAMTTVVPAFAAAAENDSSFIDEYQVVPYSYQSIGVDEEVWLDSSFLYSDRMLLEGANSLSTDLAKASVALSSAAYDADMIMETLDTLQFTYDETAVAAAYDKVDASQDNITIHDNDYVAYVISSKEFVSPDNGEKYIAYCIPVKGTSANAEWFSNFHLGDTGKHTGFHVAAGRIYDALCTAIENETEEYDADHRIVWLTGHSRGAAVANILAGTLSDSCD